MDWKTASTLKTLGNERAIAVPVILDELLLYTRQDGQSPIEAYGVRDLIDSKLPAMLGAVSLLQNYHKQPSAMNIARVSHINTQKGDAAAMALTEMGLFIPGARRIYPYDKLARYKDGRTTWVRKWEMGRVIPIFDLTELGKLAVDDEDICDEIKNSVRH